MPRSSVPEVRMISKCLEAQDTLGKGRAKARGWSRAESSPSNGTQGTIAGRRGRHCQELSPLDGSDMPK